MFDSVMIIIGDTMGRPYNLVEIEFGKLSKAEKRESFAMMDIALKRIHEKNFKVDSFDPSDIFFEDGLFFFKDVTPINYNVDSKGEAILDDIIGLSNLAFCSYLPSYDLSNGLLNTKVVSEQFDKFVTIFEGDDKDYYRSVLVDSFNSRQLPNTVYYSDFVKEKGSNGRAMVKSTLAGKLMDNDKLDNAAFGNTFFFACMVATMIMAFIGLAIYFLK